LATFVPISNGCDLLVFEDSDAIDTDFLAGVRDLPQTVPKNSRSGAHTHPRATVR